MMTPRSPSSSGSAWLIGQLANRMTLKVPIRLTWITWVNMARSCGPDLEMVRPARPMPAQFTTTRGAPSLSVTDLTEASVLGPSATLVFRYSPPISLAFFSPSSSCTSKIATLAPAAASAEAVAPPNPDAPPVTMAACPLTFIVVLRGSRAFLAGPLPLPSRRESPCLPHETLSRSGQRDPRAQRLLAQGARHAGQGAVHRRGGVGVLLRHRSGDAAGHPRQPVWRAGLFRDAVRRHPGHVAGPGLHRRRRRAGRRLCGSPQPYHRSASREGARLAVQGAGVRDGLARSGADLAANAARRRSRPSCASRWAM